MEQAGKQLDFPIHTVQNQCLIKLFKEATQKHRDEPKKRNAELEMFWQLVRKKDTNVCAGACQGIINLVTTGQLDLKETIQNFQNYLPKAENDDTVIRALCKLIVHETEILTSRLQEGEKFTSPYAIRSPPHPLILALRNKPGAWHAVLNNASNILNQSNERLHIHLVSMMAPLVSYVLLEPNQPWDLSTARMCLVRMLMKPHVNSRIGEHLLALIVDCLPLMQESSGDVERIQVHVELLQYCFVHLKESINNQEMPVFQTMRKLVDNSLILICDLVQRNLNPQLMLESLIALLESMPILNLHLDTLLYCIRILQNTPSCYHQQMAPLVIVILEKNKGYNQFHLGMIIFATLQILNSPTIENMGTPKDISFLMQTLEMKLMDVKGCHASLKNPSPRSRNESLYVKLLDRFVEKPGYVKSWLKHVQNLVDCKKPSCYCLSLIASICISSDDRAILCLAADTIAVLVRRYPDQGLRFLPVILYCLNKKTDPVEILKLMHLIPKLATHKFALLPVLQVLLHLAQTSRMKPLIILLITNLWKLHDRCFPQLIKLLTVNDCEDSPGGNVNGLLLAKAQAAKQICYERPHVHGQDMVAIISQILSHASSEMDVTAAVLCIQALEALCREEVIEIKSLWKAMESKFLEESRPLVLQEMCNLFALVPELCEGKEEYQEFMAMVTNLLWTLTKHTDELICCAAYMALAKFPQDSFFAKHLPPGDTPRSTDEEESESTMPQGVSYTKLLDITPVSAYQGLGELLGSLVREELENLSRSVYNMVNPKPTGSMDRLIESIPRQLQLLHSNMRNPSVKPLLATGLLFAYDPILPIEKDGKPKKSSIITYGRSYHQMLYTLLNEVNLTTSDWLLLPSIPGSWVSFVKRCFIAYYQCRVAELESHLERGKVSGLEEHDIQMQTAWFWTRDKIMDLLSSSSKTSPMVQANCIHALAGLIEAVIKHASTISSDEVERLGKSYEFLSHYGWLKRSINTLVLMVTPNFKVEGHSWNLGSGTGEKSSVAPSLLARGAACTALAQIVPHLCSGYSHCLHPVINAMVAGLPGNTEYPDMSLLVWGHGLGLGVTLASLVQLSYLETADAESKVHFWKAFYDLEKAALGEFDNRLGSMLGLAVCLSAFSSEGSTESKVLVEDRLSKFWTILESAEQLPDNDFGSLCMCLSICTASGFASNVCKMDFVNSVVEKLYRLASIEKESTNSISWALSHLLHCLMRVDHPTVNDLAVKMMESIVADMTNEENEVNLRKQSQVSMFCMIGLMTSWTMTPLEQGNKVIDVIERTSAKGAIQEVLTLLSAPSGCNRMSNYQVSLMSSACLCLGGLYLVVSGIKSIQNSVPSSYQYLGKKSVLNALVNVVVDAGKKGPEMFTSSKLKVALHAICEGHDTKLPPLNWTAVISPILRLPYGDEIQRLCFLILLKQCKSSLNARQLLGTWLKSPLLQSLQSSSIYVLHGNLATLVCWLSSTHLEEFLTTSLMKSVLKPGFEAQPAIEGLSQALKVKPLSSHTSSILHKILTTLAVQGDQDTYSTICTCFTSLPDGDVDTIISACLAEELDIVRHLQISCHLIRTGKRQICCINPLLDMLLYQASQQERRESLSILASCLLASTVEIADDKLVERKRERTNWLLNILGHVSGLAQGSTALPKTFCQSLYKVVQFGLSLIALGIACSTYNHVDIVFAGPYTSKQYEEGDLLVFMAEALEDLAHSGTLDTAVWLDWLLKMRVVCQREKWYTLDLHIKECCFSLRHTKDYAKPEAWSSICN